MPFESIVLIDYEPVFAHAARSVKLKKQQEPIELKMVGSGSYANVYSYVDPDYGIKFAVKRAKKSLEERDLQRFKHEFEVMSVNHGCDGTAAKLAAARGHPVTTLGAIQCGPIDVVSCSGGRHDGRAARCREPMSRRGPLRFRRPMIGNDVERPVPSSPVVSHRKSIHPRRDTGPELELRRRLHAMGLRYRVNLPISGARRRTIDIAFTRAHVAVFADGCFWHSCQEHGSSPASNSSWWAAKLARNTERDLETTSLLQNAGWRVLRVWEHDDPDEVAEIILAWLQQSRG